MGSLLLVLLVALAAGEYNYKRLAGPPSEFFEVRTKEDKKGKKRTTSHRVRCR